MFRSRRLSSPDFPDELTVAHLYFLAATPVPKARQGAGRSSNAIRRAVVISNLNRLISRVERAEDRADTEKVWRKLASLYGQLPSERGRLATRLFRLFETAFNFKLAPVARALDPQLAFASRQPGSVAPLLLQAIDDVYGEAGNDDVPTRAPRA